MTNRKFLCLLPSFTIGDTVRIDGDEAIKAVISGILWRAHGMRAECNWFAGGVQQVQWIDAWRLEVIG